MNPLYRIQQLDSIYSPALVFYRDLIAQNIAEAIRWVGSPKRLCPHAKTHKTREIARMQLEAGITSHKCATVAEAEMLAQVGIPDVILAYPIIGPNVGRVRALCRKYPQTSFSVLCDHPDGAKGLANGWEGETQRLKVLMDINVGQNRTGISIGAEAETLYRWLAQAPSLEVTGFHVYDGHNSQVSRNDRCAIVQNAIGSVLEFRRTLEAQGAPVQRIVVGGTPSFPFWAKIEQPGIQCSPGTFVLYDQGYGVKYEELATFQPAALVVTRVISKPLPNRVTLDLGHKAIAADPPAGHRCEFLNVRDYQVVLQSEEHLCFESETAKDWHIGDVVYAVPTHVCPTVALHRKALVVSNNEIVGEWEIASRDRFLTV
jgi:D-serine deaminase-like pyridoxal phosphate-dependent protein